MPEIDNLSISIGASAASAIAELDKLATSLTRFSGASRKVKTSADSVNKGFEDVASSAQKAETHTSSFADKLGKLQSTLSKTVPKFKELGSAAVSIGKVSFSPVTSAFTSLGNAAKGAMSSVSGLFSTISRIAFYRLIRSAIKLVTEALSEGIKNLYHYSEAFNGTFYQSMNRIATSANYLKNSLAAMVSPLINAVTPVLEAITDKIVDVFNLVNQFIARLTGQSTYTAAKKVASLWDTSTKSAAASTAKTTKDSADKVKDTVKKTADEIKRYTLAFDELNILGKNKDGDGDSGVSGALGGITSPSSGASGASSGTDYGSMFETRKIEGAVSDFADAIRKAFMSQDWESLGSLIGKKINSAIDSVNWGGIGKKVGNALNGVIVTAYHLLDTINFTNIGKHIAEFLNNAIGQIDYNTLGRLMVKKLTIIPDMIIGFLSAFDFGQAAAKLSDFVIGLFDELSKWLQSTDWEALGQTIVDDIVDFFTNLKYEDLASSFSEFLGSALGAGLALITGIGEKLWENVVSSIKNGWNMLYEKRLKETGGNVPKAILLAIGDAFSAISSWINENIFQPFLKGLNSAFGMEGGSSSEKMKEPGEGIASGILNGIVKGLVGLAEWVKSNILQQIWNAITTGWKELPNVVLGIGAAIETTAEALWELLKAGWNLLPDVAVGIGAFIKTTALALWNGLKFGWEKLTDKAVSFVAMVDNTANEWWSNVKTWWSEKVGYVQDFLVNVKNTSTKWWSDVKGWWKEKVGYVQEFLVNVNNRSATWWSNVRGWWREKLGANDGSSFTEFTVKVRQNAWDWWNSVSSAWYNWTRNLTLNANARIQGYYYTGNGGGGYFANGGSIDAYGNIRRFANGGIINAYASGTARAIGSLFLAGEAGPEIVGHVGGRTEVLNKSQLAATMYAAVNAAMAPAAAGFASAAQYLYEAQSGTSGEDMGVLLELVRAGSNAVQRQNELMRQQNEYLRQINDKDWNPEISTASINRSQTRMNRRAGTTIVAVGNT